MVTVLEPSALPMASGLGQQTLKIAKNTTKSMEATNSPRRLEAFVCQEKVWTVDPRLQEFRYMVYGQMPEFVPFDSERGAELLRAMEAFCDSAALSDPTC